MTKKKSFRGRWRETKFLKNNFFFHFIAHSRIMFELIKNWNKLKKYISYVLRYKTFKIFILSSVSVFDVIDVKMMKYFFKFSNSFNHKFLYVFSYFSFSNLTFLFICLCNSYVLKNTSLKQSKMLTFSGQKPKRSHFVDVKEKLNFWKIIVFFHFIPHSRIMFELIKNWNELKKYILYVLRYKAFKIFIFSSVSVFDVIDVKMMKYFSNFLIHSTTNFYMSFLISHFPTLHFFSDVSVIRMFMCCFICISI